MVQNCVNAGFLELKQTTTLRGQSDLLDSTEVTKTYKLLQSTSRVELRLALDQVFDYPVSELTGYIHIRQRYADIIHPTHRNADGVDSEAHKLINVLLVEPGGPGLDEQIFEEVCRRCIPMLVEDLVSRIGISLDEGTNACCQCKSGSLMGYRTIRSGCTASNPSSPGHPCQAIL